MASPSLNPYDGPIDFPEFAPSILNCLQGQGGPMPFWAVVNRVGQLHATRMFITPRKRQWRSLRWAVLTQLGFLIRSGRIMRVNRKFVCLPEHNTKFPAGSDKVFVSEKGGSTCLGRNPQKQTTRLNLKPLPVIKPWEKPKALIPTPVTAPQLLIVPPCTAEIHAAASALAVIPRGRRRPWSGFLDGKRLRRLTPVVLPEGLVVPAYMIRRGFVFVVLPDRPEFEGRLIERYRAQDVQVYRSPEAALLGSQKRGHNERKSDLKAMTARRNGCQPCRPGSRPRGRPCKK